MRGHRLFLECDLTKKLQLSQPLAKIMFVVLKTLKSKVLQKLPNALAMHQFFSILGRISGRGRAFESFTPCAKKQHFAYRFLLHFL